MPTRDHLLSRIGPKRWPPGFFPGSCGACCTSTAYHIRTFANDSSATVLAQQADLAFCDGLWWDGTELTAVYTESTSPQIRVVAYDETLATIRTIHHTYNTPTTGSGFNGMAACRCGNGSYALLASRTSGDSTKHAAAQVADADSLSWETSLDNTYSGGSGEDGVCVIGDSSGNVYLASVYGTSVLPVLYKFNSSGVKQWTATVGGIALGGYSRPRQICIASDGYIWVSTNNGFLSRVDTSGTVDFTISTYDTSNDDAQGNLQPDAYGGVWVGINNDPAYYLLNYDDSGTLLTVLTDSEMFLPFVSGTPNEPVRVCRFAVDNAADEIYAIVDLGSDFRVRKYDVSGSTIWTSANIGWLSNGPKCIAVDSSYIFVGGRWFT